MPPRPAPCSNASAFEARGPALRSPSGGQKKLLEVARALLLEPRPPAGRTRRRRSPAAARGDHLSGTRAEGGGPVVRHRRARHGISLAKSATMSMCWPRGGPWSPAPSPRPRPIPAWWTPIWGSRHERKRGDRCPAHPGCAPAMAAAATSCAALISPSGRETIIAVIGPNGSGKSSFVKTIAGLLPARAGSVSVTGRDVTASPPLAACSPASPMCPGGQCLPQPHDPRESQARHGIPARSRGHRRTGGTC